jgi:hypothetical protein
MDAFADALDDAAAARPDVADEDGPTVVQIAGGVVGGVVGGVAGGAGGVAVAAADMAGLASRAAAESGVGGRPAGAVTQVLEPPRRRRALRIGIAVTAAVIAVGLGIAAGTVWSRGRDGMSMDGPGISPVAKSIPADAKRIPADVKMMPANVKMMPAATERLPVDTARTPLVAGSATADTPGVAAGAVVTPSDKAGKSVDHVITPVKPGSKPPVRVIMPVATRIGSAKTVVTSVPSAAPSAAPAGSPDAGTGAIAVNASPWAYVSIDGHNYGQTPKVVNDLPAGNHSIFLNCPDTGRTETLQVLVKPGEKVVKIVNLE